MTPTPDERTSAGGPDFKMQHAVEDASRSYRGRAREGSVRAEILAALEAGRSLTSGDALRAFGGARLAADVHELKRLGWPIVSETIEVTSRRGRVSKVARYRLLK